MKKLILILFSVVAFLTVCKKENIHKNTVIRVEKGRGVPGEWDRFKHVYDDIVVSAEYV